MCSFSFLLRRVSCQSYASLFLRGTRLMFFQSHLHCDIHTDFSFVGLRKLRVSKWYDMYQLDSHHCNVYMLIIYYLIRCLILGLFRTCVSHDLAITCSSRSSGRGDFQTITSITITPNNGRAPYPLSCPLLEKLILLIRQLQRFVYQSLLVFN